MVATLVASREFDFDNRDIVGASEERESDGQNGEGIEELHVEYWRFFCLWYWFAVDCCVLIEGWECALLDQFRSSVG